jgi:hypothetical protein
MGKVAVDRDLTAALLKEKGFSFFWKINKAIRITKQKPQFPERIADTCVNYPKYSYILIF